MANSNPPVTDPKSIQIVSTKPTIIGKSSVAKPAEANPANLPEAKTQPEKTPNPVTLHKHEPARVEDNAEYDFEDDLLEEQESASTPAVSSDEPAPGAAAPAAPPPPPKHGARLTALAKTVGISDAEIEAMDRASLIEEIRVVQMMIEHDRRLSNIANATRQRQETPPPPPAPEPGIDWGKDKDGNPLKEEDYGTVIASAIKAAHEGKKEIARLQAELKAERETRQNETLRQWIDRRFAERPDLFGKGEIRQDSLAFRRRVSISTLLQTMEAAQGTWDQKYDHVLSCLFEPAAAAAPPAPAAAPRRSVHDALAAEEAAALATARVNGNHPNISEEDYAGAAHARPNARVAQKDPKGVKRAKKKFLEQMEELGLGEDRVNRPEEENELPD